jgi:hypothetical protein
VTISVARGDEQTGQVVHEVSVAAGRRLRVGTIVIFSVRCGNRALPSGDPETHGSEDL